MKFSFLAQKLFNTPLAIHPAKAEVVVAALQDRLGIEQLEVGAYADSEFTQAKSSPRKGYDTVGGIAIIQVEGTLVQKTGSLEPYSGMTGYDGIRANVISALQDNEVKALAFLISSPGGEVSGCFDLVDFIYSMRGVKPMWSILNESAYSAAYAIASATDKIIVPRTGGVGSVGVITIHVDFSKALDKNGLKVTFIQHGNHKSDGAPEKELSPEALERIQSDINMMGQLFAETVARNRSMTVDAVKDTQAMTYLGQKGVDVGFADEVMPADAAFQSLLDTLG